MPVSQHPFCPASRLALGLLSTCLALGGSVGTVAAKEPIDIAGTWQLSLARSHASCRVMLQAQRSDRGDYFLGMPALCRHAMPGVERVGRWTMPDAIHVSFEDPGGNAVLTFVAIDSGYTAAAAEGTYALTPTGVGRSAASPVDSSPAADQPAEFVRVATKRAKEAPVARETTSDLAGRYAVMREKRDTGCMVTLDDNSRAKDGGGDRAQLAPGCRDQGIVIFNPAAWQIVKGELVLTARAGHKTRLQKDADGNWQKDPQEGGKPLGLKKL